MSVTLLTDLYEPVRAVMGDTENTVMGYRYPDAALAGVIRAVLDMGKLRDIDGVTYRLTPDRTSVQPAVHDFAANGVPLALLVHEACAMLIGPQMHDAATQVRALRQRIGNRRDFFQYLKEEIYRLRNGEGGGVYTVADFHSWCLSVTGMPLWNALSDVKVERPFTTVTVGSSGESITTGTPSSGTAVGTEEGKAIGYE